MLHPSTKKLIDRLAEMTELGKLDWVEGEGGKILYSTEGYSVSLSESPNEVLITSKDGKELEHATADELAASQNESGVSYTDIVAGMTKEASRIARGTETAISTLLAGMDDPVPEVEVTEPPLSEIEATEDVADDTNAVAAEDIETVAEAAPAEPEEVILADTQESEPEAGAEETVEARSDDPDSEPNVTEAVARLADEVNNREESTLDAAAASAAGAVALAAGLTTDTSEEEPTVAEAEAVSEPEPEAPAPIETVAEVEEIVISSNTEVIEPAEETAPESVAAFGSDEMATAEEESTVAEAPAEDTAPVVSEPVSLETVETVAEAAEAVPETAPEAAPTPAYEYEAETVTPPTVDAAEAPETPEAPIVETVSAEIAPDPVIETPEPAPEEVTIAAAPEVTDTVEEVSEATPAPETAPEPAPAQSYSLSGIGAGFGLGALSAKTEASGVPGPSNGVGVAEEKIIIDATEDVLPDVEGSSFSAAADTVSTDLSFGKPEGSQTPAEGEAENAEEDSMLKPRTRFNPWD